MKKFSDVAGSIAEDAVRYAMQSGITLDYTADFLAKVPHEKIEM